jgi:DNA-directed RNA polymerase specialized sigma24 family protein
MGRREAAFPFLGSFGRARAPAPFSLLSWRGCPFPDEPADETINRVAHKIEDGLGLSGDSIHRYFHGAARMLAKETFKKRSREQSELSLRFPLVLGEDDDHGRQARLECLRSCMSGLSPEECELLLQYYRGEKGEKIRNRKELADRLNIPMNALRIRVHRLREELERCMEECPRARDRHEMS